MRDRKVPDDEYNRRLHIYAETPGLQQAPLVPASEKELNTPVPQPPSSSIPATQGHSSIQTNPYARIPAANLVEEEEEDDGGVPVSRFAPGGASSSSHPTPSSLSLGTRVVRKVDGETFVAPKRDPIYAELDHRHSEDDRTENGGEQNSSGQTAPQTASSSSSSSSRTSQNIPPSSQGTNDEQSRRVPPLPPSKRPAPLPGSSIAKKLDLGRGSGPNTKTIRTHTRLDASLEIPATQRPKPQGTEHTDDGGQIKLIKKTERSPEVGQPTSSTSENGNDVTTRVGTSGIILTHVRSIDGHTTVTKISTEGETQSSMPVDPDLDAGTAIIKKKRRFRRNMIFIISFLMILLVVVAAVIISLVIVTKAGRFW